MDTQRIGPYRFAEIDLRRTVRHALDMVDHHGVADGDGVRARITGLLADVDAEVADAAELVPVVEAVWPELVALRSAATLPARAEGQVHALALGSGGVPKPTVDRVEVDHGGVVGDVQAARQHHGSPWQALCLWSAEVIDGLVADGHPIAPGAAGENVTIAGLPWAEVRPGARLRLGEVEAQVMSYAVPCQKNARWFSDRRFGRIHHDKGDLSRLYAAVVTPGTIAVGDPVVLEP